MNIFGVILSVFNFLYFFSDFVSLGHKPETQAYERQAVQA